jgi:mRNA interferase YafQ
MYALSFTNRFEKDLKLIKKRSAKDLRLHDFLKNELAVNGAACLPSRFRAHKLSGDYNDKLGMPCQRRLNGHLDRNYQ